MFLDSLRNWTCVFAGLLLAGCVRPAPSPAGPRAEAAEPLKATVWTDHGELYLEYPQLVAARKHRFAIHLTRLADFRAVKDAACEVRLTHGVTAEVFACDASSHPGIFGATVEPKTAGRAQLMISVTGRDLSESFRVGEVAVASKPEEAAKEEESAGETLSYAKEQQWALDFGTALVAPRQLRESLRVSAETQPRTGGEVAVIAPLSGRIVAERTWTVGDTVEKDAELAGILPPRQPDADPASLQLAEAEATVLLDQARRDRARADDLLAAGAVSTKRAEDARTAEATAQARLKAAKARLANYETTRNAEAGGRASRFVIRAPIGGVISESDLTSGSNAEAGKVLARIVDTRSLFVTGAVPESEIPNLARLSGAAIEWGDAGETRPTGRLVSMGKLVDRTARTVPVTYELDNRDQRFAVHQSLYLRLLLGAATARPAIPESAIVDDDGHPAVFVQLGGETFAKRAIKAGVSEGGFVEVLQGLSAGERIVTKGAYLIRLSSMSSAVPAHGHVH